jgi:wobble nucleotide-excising tRNase
VPHIYSYLQEIQKGVPANEITPITENEINELRNLEKKVAYLKEKLGDTGSQTESEGSEDEEVDIVQPKKKNINKQRQGVSAEVYGNFNKKGDFKPKVIAKSADTINKLRARLLQAFMFSALDEDELKIVVDAIEEIRGAPNDVIIKEGD